MQFELAQISLLIPKSIINFGDSIIYLGIWFAHRYILPKRVLFGTKHEYRVQLLSKSILLLQFIVLKQVYPKGICFWLFLTLAIIVILPNIYKIITSRKEMPEFLFISNDKSKWPKYLGIARLKLNFTEYLMHYRDQAEGQSMDGIVTSGLNPAELRSVISTTTHKVYKYSKNKITRITDLDLLLPNQCTRGTPIYNKVGILFGRTKLHKRIRAELKNTNFNYIELRDLKNITKLDLVIDMSCINNDSDIQYHYSAGANLAKLLKNSKIPLVLPINQKHSIKTNNSLEIQDIYKSILKQYNNTTIIDMPSIFHREMFVGHLCDQRKYRLCNLYGFTNYIYRLITIDLSETEVIEIDAGEELTGTSIKKLIDYLNGPCNTE